ncbi:MAG: HIT domain-containing protein [bacterium]|nr:HIT domain-containing protein [bacterium]
MKKKFVNVHYAKSKEYKRVIETIASTGKCPFCKEDFKYPSKAKGKKEIHLFAYHEKPVFKQKNGWFLTENSWPYKNSRRHLIIIGDKHKENFSDLTKKDLEAVGFLVNWAIKEYKIKGGALAMRFGNTDYTGASVAHLHFHIISPKINKKTGRAITVNFPIG